jgi:hypothetical protein
MPHIGTGRISLFFEEAGSGGIPVLLLHELGGSSAFFDHAVSPRGPGGHAKSCSSAAV